MHVSSRKLIAQLLHTWTEIITCFYDLIVVEPEEKESMRVNVTMLTVLGTGTAYVVFHSTEDFVVKMVNVLLVDNLSLNPLSVHAGQSKQSIMLNSCCVRLFDGKLFFSQGSQQLVPVCTPGYRDR